MSFEEVRLRRAPRYEDEDTSPTTSRELQGWYSYTIAAEVFAVVGVGKRIRHRPLSVGPEALHIDTNIWRKGRFCQSRLNSLLEKMASSFLIGREHVSTTGTQQLREDSELERQAQKNSA